MRCVLLAALAAAAVGLTGGPARADFMVQAGVWGTGGGLYAGISDHIDTIWSPGTRTAYAAGDDGAVGASASIRLLANPGIRLAARAATDTVWTPEGGIYSSQSRAVAQWIDVVRVAGFESPPESIRITVRVDGIHKYVVDGIPAMGGGNAAISVELGTLINGVGLVGGSPPPTVGGLSGALLQTSGIVGDENGLRGAGNTRDLEVSGSYAYIWLADFDLPYSSTYGGYLLNLYAALQVSGFRGSDSEADFSNTIRLIGVSQANGSALPGPVTFESGFILAPAAAVPEPTSAGLLGIGLVGLAARRLRRFRAA